MPGVEVAPSSMGGVTADVGIDGASGGGLNGSVGGGRGKGRGSGGGPGTVAGMGSGEMAAPSDYQVPLLRCVAGRICCLALQRVM